MEKNGVIVIGGSAGSIEVIIKMIAFIPDAFQHAIVIVIHRKPTSEYHLEDVLNRKSKIKVFEIQDKMQLETNCIYLVPGDYHLLIDKNGTMCLDTTEKVNYSRPSIDVTFECFAKVYKKRCIGILLSGANSDGAEGLKKIKEHGGIAIVQSPESAAVATMPMAAINLFFPDIIADTSKICHFIEQAAYKTIEQIITELHYDEKQEEYQSRILLVDDLDDNLFALKAILKSEPYHIDITKSGSEAIEMAIQNNYDCIILDIQMPEMDGFEVAKHLAKNEETKNIPIIFLSALGSDKEKVIQGIDSGAIDFLAKPPDPSLLKAKVRLCIKISKKTKETTKTVDKIKFENETIKEFASDVSASLRYAQNIQHALLPKEDILASHFNQSFIFFQPKESIGGDFYYVKEISDELIIICGDCTGHGVPGAMMTMISLNIIHNIVENKKITSPKQILKEIANEFISSFRNEYNSASINDGMELSVCTYKKSENTLLYSGAGRPIIKSSENTIERVHPNPDGINGNIPYDVEFTEHCFKIKQGDRFCMYTDGIVDQFGGPKGKKFMTKNLIKLLSETSNISINNQFDYIKKALKDWQGNEEQVDDILIISFGF
jgi:sigma-B regulation protein RsbU (phosphoserine phosphatase)